MRIRLSIRNCYLIIAAFTLVLLAAFLTLDQMAPAGRRLAKVKGLDPVNYFGISHSLLFDHDFNLNNEFEHMPPDARLWSGIQKPSGLPASPWGIGYSVLEMPMIAIGTAVDGLIGNPMDGYSRGAIMSYCLGNIFMTGLGMMALFTFFYRVAFFWEGEAPGAPGHALAATFAVFFGTNVGYYSFSQTSHTAAFLFASLFLAYWWQIRSSWDGRKWMVLGLIGGFLSVIRWQDILYLAGPILFDLLDRESLKRFRPWLRSRIGYAVAAFLWWIPQIAEWKIIYNKYLTVPQGPGFLKLPPAYIPEVLFSSRNGWFLWTPLILIGLAGLLYGMVKAKAVFLPWLVVIALEICAVASMKTWHGQDSFGARYLLSVSPIAGLGVLTLICRSGSAARIALGAAICCCGVFTSLFAIQYRFDLIPNNQTLTATEMFTDKLRIPAVRRRKASVASARNLLARGDAAAAIRTLENVPDPGDDRQVLEVLEQAYAAAGRPAQAAESAARLKKLLDSRFF